MTREVRCPRLLLLPDGHPGRDVHCDGCPTELRDLCVELIVLWAEALDARRARTQAARYCQRVTREARVVFGVDPRTGKVKP